MQYVICKNFTQQTNRLLQHIIDEAVHVIFFLLDEINWVNMHMRTNNSNLI
jgi:hypothetical protein